MQDKEGGMITTILDGNWELTAVSPMKSSGIAQDSTWEMKVPGSLHDTLLDNKLIEEPYDGDEIERTKWIGESTWKVGRTFNIDAEGEMAFLKCGGLSACTVVINGKEAARTTEDAPLLCDITPFIHNGENKIEIIFPGILGMGTGSQFPDIWRSIRLLTDPSLIIAGMEADPLLIDEKWKLVITVSAIAGKTTETEYLVAINGKESKGTIRIPEGSGEYTIEVDPGDVSQWWPSGYGNQPIYPVSVSIGGYSSSRDVAFRTAAMTSEGLFVNDRKIFLKAVGYDRENIIASRTDKTYLEKLMKSVADANMNAIIMKRYAGRTLRDAAKHNGILVINKDDLVPGYGTISAPSFPSEITLERIWNDGERNISSPAADLHGEGAGRILSEIASSFLFPEKEKKLVYLSGVKAAELASAKAGEARIRGHRGMVLSSLIDPWPAISDAALEYGGKWKLLQYAARRFFAPLAPVILKDNKTVSIYFVNDTLHTADAEFSIKTRDFSGMKRDAREYSITAKAGEAVKVAEYSLSRMDKDGTFLYVKMSTKDFLRERTVLLDKPKYLRLENPEMVVSTAQSGPHLFAVKLKVSKPAFCVALDSRVKGLFSDNVISVRPSAEKTIFFKPEEDTTLEEFTKTLKVMDLYSAMH